MLLLISIKKKKNVKHYIFANKIVFITRSFVKIIPHIIIDEKKNLKINRSHAANFRPGPCRHLPIKRVLNPTLLVTNK